MGETREIAKDFLTDCKMEVYKVFESVDLMGITTALRLEKAMETPMDEKLGDEDLASQSAAKMADVKA